jgi:hypothetical protein
MHNGDVVAETGSSGSAPAQDRPALSACPADMHAVTFLQTALTSGTANVSALEILARAAGFLGEHQRISQSKQFKRAKITLGIQSVRQGFGPGGGWAWVLPPPANASASEAKPKEPVIRAEPERGPIYGDGIVGAAPMGSVIDNVEMPPEFRDIVGVPSSWLEGIARLERLGPSKDVLPHLWRQFVIDCHKFVIQPEEWARRAADLGWDASALFGHSRRNPRVDLGCAGLLWMVGGGDIIRLHSTWAEIQPPAGSRRTYHRRRVDPSAVTVPWLR